MKRSLGRLTAGLNPRSFDKLRMRSFLRNGALLTVGALILAINVNLFLAPHDIAPGGVSGLAIIINHFTGWRLGLVMLVLNLPLLAVGWRYLGRFRFLTRTAYVVLLYNLGVDLLAGRLPALGVTDDLLLNSLYGGLVGGIASGLVFRGGGTIGGTGIISRILQKRTGIPVSQVYLITDGAVILLAGIVFGWEKALYALISVFVWGLATDYVLEGPSVVRTAFVITDRPDAVAEAVLGRLGLGVTAWPALGMFTKVEHTLLFCTLSRADVEELRSLVAAADPDAFVVIAHGHQARGGVVRGVIGRAEPPQQSLP